MSDIDKIVAMLGDKALEKRMAAAIVLGEIKARGPEVVEGLAQLAGSDIPTLQTHALNALSRVGARKVVERLFPLLTVRDHEVRIAAAKTIASVGDDVVPIIRKRIPTAGVDERRGLDAVLAGLGGKDAFSALLANLATSDTEAARAAALAVRAHLRDAARPERRACLTQTEAFLRAQTKVGGQPGAIAAAIKILGYIGDPKALPTVLGFVRDTKQPAAVRQEALIALRFVMGEVGASRDEAVFALIDAASENDATIAQTAMLTLGGVVLTEAHGVRLRKLVDHPDFERARMVLEKLGQQKDLAAARLLATVLATAEKRRADIAGQLIASQPDAATPLARALLEARDADRRWSIRTALRPLATRIPAALRKQLLEAGVERLEAGERNWEAYVDVALVADPAAAADAMRSVAEKLRKKQPDKSLAALSVLCRGEHASDEDHWHRALLELHRSPRDLSPGARAADESLKQLERLASRGFDVVGRLRKDRTIEMEAVYYVGFHFAERHEAIGAELLRVVIEKEGRTKLAKMARSKLGITK